MDLLYEFVSTGFVVNAFVVTPIINEQRDAMLEGDDTAGKKFKHFHFVSVAIFLAQLITSSYIVVTNIIQDV